MDKGRGYMVPVLGVEVQGLKSRELVPDFASRVVGAGFRVKGPGGTRPQFGIKALFSISLICTAARRNPAI